VKEFFVAVSTILAIGAVLPYAVDTARGKTHPRLASWSTFALLNGINTVIAAVEGALESAIFSGALTVGTLAVVLLGFKNGIKQYQSFDAKCHLAAGFGIVVWWGMEDPKLAVLIVLAVNIVAMLPTLRHAAREPHAETWQTFAINLAASACALFAIKHYTFVAVVIPLYVMVMSVVLVTLILSRRRTLGRVQTPAL
jgi:hypothetical protein